MTDTLATSTNATTVEAFAYELRCDVVKMLTRAGSGHLGGCLSSADILATLFGRAFVDKVALNGREVYPFVLSVGHLAPLYYATLARMGAFPLEELWTLRQLDTRLEGHPSIREEYDRHTGGMRPPLPGLLCGSGSLGQGLSIAAGVASAWQLDDAIENKIFVLLGDGELQEGQIWEAAMFASAQKLKNLIAIVDVNGQQLDGTTKEVLDLNDLCAKWHAFGWEVETVDGHSCRAIDDALQKLLSSELAQPKILLASTEMGHGIPEIANNSAWHGRVPTETELPRFLEILETTYSEKKLSPQLLHLAQQVFIIPQSL